MLMLSFCRAPFEELKISKRKNENQIEWNNTSNKNLICVLELEEEMLKRRRTTKLTYFQLFILIHEIFFFFFVSSFFLQYDLKIFL